MRSTPFLFVLAFLSVLSGYFLSKASLVGRAGIHFFYQEYRFLSVWWQGALVVFAVYLILFLLLLWVHKKAAPKTAVLIAIITLLAAIAGLWLTYNDFRTDLSHRLLGERFHLGAYLFWVGGLFISLFYLFVKRRKRA